MTEHHSRSTKQARRGEYAPGVKRRRIIVQTVLQVVDHDGYESVTVGLISQITGIPEASILYHFPTRDHLLIGALEYSDDMTGHLSGIDRQELTFDMETFSERLDTLLAQRNRRMLAIHMRGKSMLDDHPAHDYFRSFDRRAVEVWTRVVIGMQGGGVAHPGLDPRETAIRIVALWDGLSLLNAVDPELDIKKHLLQGMREICGINWQEFVHTVQREDLGL